MEIRQFLPVPKRNVRAGACALLSFQSELCGNLRNLREIFQPETANFIAIGLLFYCKIIALFIAK